MSDRIDMRICLILLAAIAGCSDTPTSVLQPTTLAQLPAIVLVSAFQSATGSVDCETTVNPEGISASCYIEYGPTASYGLRTPTQDAGSGSAPVFIGAMLNGLTTGVTYHWRLAASSIAGTIASSDTTFTVRRPFVMPLAAGTVWRYRVNKLSWSGGSVRSTWGRHAWTVTSTLTSGGTTTLQIQDMETDSVTAPFSTDTTTSVSTLAFAIAISGETLTFCFPESGTGYPTIAKYSLDASDTLTVQLAGYTTIALQFVNQIGLTSYSMWTGSPINGSSISCVLESMYRPGGSVSP